MFSLRQRMHLFKHCPHREKPSAQGFAERSFRNTHYTNQQDRPPVLGTARVTTTVAGPAEHAVSSSVHCGNDKLCSRPTHDEFVAEALNVQTAQAFLY